MKYCSMPFEYLYLDHYNGNVYLCPWMNPQKGCIGNIIEQDFQDIWKGKKAEELRDTARKGTYEYCRMVACPLLQNNTLENRVCDSDNPWVAADTPKMINLAFDFVCNQSCPTCRCGVFIPGEDYSQNCEKIINKLQPIFNKAQRITASGHGDPFASPYMMKILEELHPENEKCEIWLETNGVFFDEAHWNRIKHLSKYHLEITITTNSYREEVYNLVSRGGDFEKLRRNELFLKRLREQDVVKKSINAMVVQDRTYLDIPDFIDQSLNGYGFDQVILRPVYNWGNLTEEEYWFKDVLNPLHPYNEEYQRIINLPIVKDNPRVYNFGGTMMHEPKPMPGSGSAENMKNRAYFDLFRSWLKADVKEEMSKYLSDKTRQQVMIYGVGDVGRALARMFKGDPVVKGFIDAFSPECEVDGLPVWRIGAEETMGADMIVITPIHASDSIKKDLTEAHYCAEMVSILDILR